MRPPVALVVAPAVYLGHALVDYSWDFLAVTAPTMVALGVLAAAGRPAGEPRRRLFLALGAIVLAATVLVSFSFPRLADRYERSSTRALVGDDFERARDRALWARFFNPVSVDPIFALARIAERRRFPVTAGREYIRAVELQPENPETWFALGLYEFQVRRNLCAAYRFLNNAYTLDPAGNQWVEGGPARRCSRGRGRGRLRARLVTTTPRSTNPAACPRRRSPSSARRRGSARHPPRLPPGS